MTEPPSVLTRAVTGSTSKGFNYDSKKQQQQVVGPRQCLHSILFEVYIYMYMYMYRLVFTIPHLTYQEQRSTCVHVHLYGKTWSQGYMLAKPSKVDLAFHNNIYKY